MKTIRVLMLVTNLRKSNGVASYVMNYFNTIDKSKIKMDFALLQDVPTPYYKEIIDAGSKYYILPKLSNPASHYKKCEQILKEGRYDVIHDNILLASIPIMMLAKRNHVPVRIIHSHNSKLGETTIKEKRNKLFLPFLLKTSNAYFACSNKAAKAMFGNENYTFIPNIVSEKRLTFSPDIRKLIREKMHVEDKTVIGTIGRVAPQKNPLFALEVISEALKRIPDLEYWWIGSGPLDKELEEAIKEYNLTDKVKMLGSRNDVPELYQAMDVFFLPSRFEGLPVTGVEAQAMGLPSVISSAVTNELVYTDLVKYVSLDAPMDDWANALYEQQSKVANRRPYNEELRNSCFSEYSAGRFLERLYYQLLQ